MKPLALLLLALLTAGCDVDSAADDAVPARAAALEDQAASIAPVEPVDSLFGVYWYQGQAELTSYRLEQARYGELRDGKAVLIFVTEDFSEAKQVKLDDPARAGDDAVKVLKLNLTKRFDTGIYPYSMMASVFTPVYGRSHPHTLKVTTSSQEWCGHTFTQLNLSDDGYRARLYSYFESEGDQSTTLDRVLLEDEVWTRLRLDPASLPTGTIRIVPGTFYQRLGHTALQVETAQAQMTAAGEGVQAYTLTYPAHDRSLTIRFETAFPHAILGWEETHRSGFGAEAQRLTTRAVRDRSMMLDYWNHNTLADAPLRAELNLE